MPSYGHISQEVSLKTKETARQDDTRTSREVLKIYLQETMAFKTKFIASLILVPLSAILIGVIVPFLLSQIIELLSRGKLLGSSEFSQALYILIFVSLASIIVNRYGFKLALQLDSDVRARLQRRAFEALIHKSYRFYADHKVGSLTSHFISFVGAHSRLQQLIINEFSSLVLTLAIGLIIILFQSIILGLTLLVITGLIVLHALYSMRKRAPLRRARKEMVSELHGVVADNISNNLIVKMLGKEKNEIAAVEKRTTELRDIFYKDFGMLAHEGNIRHSMMLTFQVIAIVVAAYLLQAGAISLGVVIFSLTYLIRLSNNLFNIGGIINQYEQAMVEATPMAEILLEADEVQDRRGAKPLKVTDGIIDFQNVSFAYESDAERIFKGLNLHIASKQKLGLVGTSGGGKSTITKLLLRLLDIQEGEITIDNQNIAQVKQQSLRTHIAYVPQEPLLFHRSLRENIAYSKPNATKQEIERAATKAHAHSFIKKLPNGYDTIVGERGVKLSGGQRQRIAIARAILADAPILILDEATSALDSESEKAIQQALANLMKDKTTIVIAHRLSTIQKMDRILVLDEGKIIEDDSHTELLKKQGTYAKLWAHQSGGFIEE
jgi:ATP-binding cassette, subfamily B, bacterial